MEYKMLIVDDEVTVTSTLKSVFLEQGYQVLIANNGDEAKKITDETQLDLILLDIEMPGLSGLQVLEHVKKNWPETKVIMVTAYGEFEKKARKLKCDEFLKKPFALGKLEEAIVKLLSTKGNEEVKEHSLGLKYYQTREGAPMADILLIEPVEELAKTMSAFLEDNAKIGGYYKVYSVESKDQALTAQQILRINIAMIDLRTAEKPNEIVEALSRMPNPPKDYIFYFKQDIPQDDEAIRTVKGKHWDGNPMDERSLRELGEILNASALKHGLVKK